MFDRPTVLESPTAATLLLRSQPAEGRARGIVLILHGLAEHSARYARLARELSALGFHVHAHDHRGHGGTRAPDAPPRRFAGKDGPEAVLRDCEAVEAFARAAHPGLPVVVLGHSMGALIAANLAARRGAALAGVALWNGNLDRGPDVFIARALFRLERAYRGSDVASALFPALTFRAWARSVPDRRRDADWLTHDEEIAAAYEADPLCGWNPTVSLAEDLTALTLEGAGRKALAALPKSLPLHLLGGGADPATKGGAAVERLAARMRRAGLMEVTSLIVPGARHETLNEIEPYRRPVMDSLTAWLERITPLVSER